jgi:hypothetical protein
MSDTIEIKFNPGALPAWARKNSVVVEICKSDLAYRCNVCTAHSKALREALLDEAWQRAARQLDHGGEL